MCEKRKALAMKRCTLRMCSEYGLLTMLTVCRTDRTTCQLLLTVGKREGRIGHLSSRFSFERASCTALPSEEGNLPSRNIFLTYKLERKLSISLGGVGRYFFGNDELRAGTGNSVMGVPPVQPSSLQPSQVAWDGRKTSSIPGTIVLDVHGYPSPSKVLRFTPFPYILFVVVETPFSTALDTSRYGAIY